MTIEPSIPAGPLSEAEIIAQIDAEQQRKSASAPAAYAPVVGVVAMMAVALPLVFALRSNPQSTDLATPGGAPAPLQPTFIAWNYNFESAQSIAAASNKTMMIAFYTDWCPACKQMDREVYGRAPIIVEAQNIVPLKINAEGQPDLARRYNIHKYPTILWTDAAGNEKHRSDGNLNGYELYQAMQQNR